MWVQHLGAAPAPTLVALHGGVGHPRQPRGGAEGVHLIQSLRSHRYIITHKDQSLTSPGVGQAYSNPEPHCLDGGAFSLQNQACCLCHLQHNGTQEAAPSCIILVLKVTPCCPTQDLCKHTEGGILNQVTLAPSTRYPVYCDSHTVSPALDRMGLRRCGGVLHHCHHHHHHSVEFFFPNATYS